MKKKIILLFLVTLFPITAKAASLEIQCTSSTITVGDSVKCTIVGKDTKVGGAGVETISVSNGSIASTQTLTCPFGSVSETTFDCVNEEAPNSVSFVAYTLKSSSVGTMTITLSDCSLVGADYKTYHYDTVSKSITVKAKPTPAQPVTKAPTQPVTQAPQPIFFTLKVP